MRVLSVTAKPFGGIENQTLTLGSGLTVVYGRNGTGKSTWHGALYAGLCGRLAGTTATDVDVALAEFAPMGRPSWGVSIDVELDDGTRVTVDRDLMGGRPDIVTCDQAVVTDRFAHNGVVDLARRLDLDRRSFAVSSWVRQKRASDADVVDHDGGAASPDFGRAVSALLGTAEALQAVRRLERVHDDRVTSAVRRAADDVAEQHRRLRDAMDRRDRVQAARADVDRSQRAAEWAEYQYDTAAAAERHREDAQRRNEIDELRRRFDTYGYLYGEVPTSRDTEVHPTVAEARREYDNALTVAHLQRAPVPPPPTAPPPTPPSPPSPPVAALPAPARRIPLAPLGAVILGLVVIAILWALGVGAPAVIAAVVLTAATAIVAGLLMRQGESNRGVASEQAPARAQAPAPAPDQAPVDEKVDAPAPVVAATPDRLARARERLAAVLTERGVPANPANIEDRFEVYRDRCELAAQLAAKESAHAATASAVLSHDPNVRPPLPGQLGQLLRDRDSARAALDEAKRRLAVLDGEFDDGAVGRAEAALTEARQRHDRQARLDRVLIRAAETLRSAAAERRNTLRGQMRVELRELLADVNDEPVLQVAVDPDMRVHIRPRPLHSYGLDDQSTVLKRIALSRNLTRTGVIPIFLDDVTSRMDEDRTRNLLRALRYLARARQVVVFAHDPTTRDWALRAADQDGPITLLETTGVDQPVRPLTQPVA